MSKLIKVSSSFIGWKIFLADKLIGHLKTPLIMQPIGPHAYLSLHSVNYELTYPFTMKDTLGERTSAVKLIQNKNEIVAIHRKPIKDSAEHVCSLRGRSLKLVPSNEGWILTEGENRLGKITSKSFLSQSYEITCEDESLPDEILLAFMWAQHVPLRNA